MILRPFNQKHLVRNLCVVLLCTMAATAHAQQQDDNVIRIKTELVQTDVNVVDKHGKFVDGVRPEDLELTLDGKPQKLLFFERVATGTKRETSQLTATRTAKQNSPATYTDDTTDRVRTIFFFVDDAHLSAKGLSRARKSLKEFIDTRMRQNDQVAIISTSGQIGFLQQLTNNKFVLTTAISRLTTKPTGDGYPGKTRITEYMASRIINQNDGRLFAYLMESTKLEQQMGAGTRHGDHRTSSSYSAGPNLQNRLRQIDNQSKANTRATLATLHTLLGTTASLQGRKLLFLVSDGFLVNQQDSELVDLMRDVSVAAAQTGTVIYSIDLREGTTSSPIDLSNNGAVDFSSRLAGLEMSERSANREPLQSMSDETGGRILLNPDSITDGVVQALDETANYYLLAWRPDSEDQRQGKSRLNVVIKNHPDWRVRVRKKFYQPSETAAKPADNQTVDPLSRALASLYPIRQAPVALSSGYVLNDGPTNTLKLSMQLNPQLFLGQLEGEKHKAEVEVLGAAVDDRGVIITFKQVLTVTPEALTGQSPVIWHQQLAAPPGLYQVRVALRERESGWTGSALEWLVVPEKPKTGIQLSSLFVAGRDAGESGGAPHPIKVNVDRVFTAGSILRFQTYIYPSATLDRSGISVKAEVRRNGQQVFAVPAAEVPAASSNDGLPYWSEISLSQMSPGRYVLIVTAEDRKTNATSTQEIDFTIK
jgi:VWFA-related protein